MKTMVNIKLQELSKEERFQINGGNDTNSHHIIGDGRGNGGCTPQLPFPSFPTDEDKKDFLGKLPY